MIAFKGVALGLLLVSGGVMAQCLPAGEPAQLSGLFSRSQDSDAITLDSAIECRDGSLLRQEDRVSLHFSGDRPYADEISDNSVVLITGSFAEGNANDPERFNVTDIISLDDDTPEDPPYSAEQKAGLVKGFVAFQQALRDRDIPAIRQTLDFPVEGFSSAFLGQEAEKLSVEEGSEPLTAARFEQFRDAILIALEPMAHIGVDSAGQNFSEYRINTLTPEEQARSYTEIGEDSGNHYYVENGKRHEVNGVCDKIAYATLNDTSLSVVIGLSVNPTLPAMSEACEYQDIFFFTLVNGEVKLVNATSAG